MPPPTLLSLLTPKTQPQLLATLLGYLAPGGLPAASGLPNAPGLPVTDWASGAVANTIAQMEAQALADLQQTLVNIAGGGFLDYAPNNAGLNYVATPGTPATATSQTWLDLLAFEEFAVTRAAPGFTLGNATLTLASGLAAVTITPNQLWMVDTLGHRYNNLTGGTLAAGSPLMLSWQADTPGTNWNIGSGTAMTLQTPIPGVTVALTGWVTTSGADIETDASLINRCRLKWAILAGNNAQGGGTSAAYQYWALNAPLNAPALPTGPAGAGFAYVLTGNPDGPGTLRVYVAPATGVFANDSVAAVVNINTQLQLVRPISSAVVVHAATSYPVTITGTVHYFAAVYSTAAAAQAALNAALAAYAASIGICDGVTTLIYASRIEEALIAPVAVGPSAGRQGIRDVQSLSITVDILPTAYTVVSFTDVAASMTWVAV